MDHKRNGPGLKRTKWVRTWSTSDRWNVKQVGCRVYRTFPFTRTARTWKLRFSSRKAFSIETTSVFEVQQMNVRSRYNFNLTGGRLSIIHSTSRQAIFHHLSSFGAFFGGIVHGWFHSILSNRFTNAMWVVSKAFNRWVQVAVTSLSNCQQMAIIRLALLLQDSFHCTSKTTVFTWITWY